MPIPVLAHVAAMQGDNQPFAECLGQRQSQRAAAGELRVDDIRGRADTEPRDEPEVAEQQALEPTQGAAVTQPRHRAAKQGRVRHDMTSNPDRRQLGEAQVLPSEKLNFRPSANPVTINQDRRQARRRLLF
jgi:hypothetical protein